MITKLKLNKIYKSKVIQVHTLYTWQKGQIDIFEMHMQAKEWESPPTLGKFNFETWHFYTCLYTELTTISSVYDILKTCHLCSLHIPSFGNKHRLLQFIKRMSCFSWDIFEVSDSMCSISKFCAKTVKSVTFPLQGPRLQAIMTPSGKKNQYRTVKISEMKIL